MVSSPIPSHRKSFTSLCPPVSETTELNVSPTTISLDDESLEDVSAKADTLEYSIASDLNSNLAHKVSEDYGPNEYAESVSSTSGETARSVPRLRRPIAKSEPYLFSQSTQYSFGYPVPQAPHHYQYNSENFNAGNRTLYLGNLHPNTQAEEIANNVRAGGLVESLKYYKSKRICFITFIDPVVALNFYMNHQVLHQLIIHGSEVNVGWGKNHSGPLNRDISLAVTAGASRNVFIGLKLANNPENEKKVAPLPTESKLRSDFSKFGDLEQINFYHNNDCGFMNFMNIIDAIKVVELFENSNVDQINQIVGDNGEFYERYRHYKISFGKDRCGNPPKFNYKKKLSPVVSREPLIPPPLRSANSSREVVNSINEETAMVFGISTEGSGEHSSFNSKHDNVETTNGFSELNRSENGYSSENVQGSAGSVPSSDDEVLTATNESHIPKAADEVSLKDDTQEEQFCSAPSQSLSGQDEEAQFQTEAPQESNADQSSQSPRAALEYNNEKDENSEVREGQNGDAKIDHVTANDNEENDEEEDEDDDISIIIGSDVTTSSHKPKTKRSYRKHDKVYNHRFGLSEGFGFEWNLFNSTLSLGSTYGYAPQYPGNYGMGYSGPVYYPQETAFYPQTHHMPYYGISQQPMQMAPVYNQGSFSTSAIGNKGSYLASGSLVMAQYLAKSQQENYIYANNILNNDVTAEEVKEYKRHGKKNSRKTSS